MKPRVHLFGKHHNRTPLAYRQYRSLLANKISFAADPMDADILLTGFSKDYVDNHDLVEEVLRRSRNCKLAIISEEPFWDSIYSLQYQNSIDSRLCEITGYAGIPCLYQAHHNSEIFEYSTIPYFITTDPRYVQRYIALLTSWLFLPFAKRREIFFERRKSFAFLAEKRTDTWYDFNDRKNGLIGLCIQRSEIGLAMSAYGDVSGKGFLSTDLSRQNLPDWHLDKITKFYNRYNIISAIENTYQKWYVTEKIFDAYACCGLPVYFAEEESSVYTVLGLQSFLNINGLSREQCINRIIDFRWDNETIERFEEDALNILKILKDISLIKQDILNRSRKLHHCLQEFLDADL